MTSTYVEHAPGEWFLPTPVFKHRCCDCGLVHTVELLPGPDGRVRMRLWRDNRATGQVRRWAPAPPGMIRA